MGNARFEFQENSYYHIYNRGFEKQTLFFHDTDYKKFYDTVIYAQKLFPEIKICSYSFLPNHFHFVVHNLETGLKMSDFMRRIQVTYAMYFKRKYETGLSAKKKPVFEGRFHAKHIDDETYLAQCIAYVNFNPLKHELVSEIDQYPWTSYHQLSSKQKLEQYQDMILTELEY